MDFDTAIKYWDESQRVAIEARIAYERAYAEALIRSTGKAAEIRKAQAELASVDLLRASDLAAVTAKAAEYFVHYLSGFRGAPLTDARGRVLGRTQAHYEAAVAG